MGCHIKADLFAKSWRLFIGCKIQSVFVLMALKFAVELGKVRVTNSRLDFHRPGKSQVRSLRDLVFRFNIFIDL